MSSGRDIGRLESLYPDDRSVLVCMNTTTLSFFNVDNGINATFQKL